MPSTPAMPLQTILRRRLATSGPPALGLDLFEAELVARLKGDPAIAALVEARVYPLVVPEAPRQSSGGAKFVTFPCLVYTITGNDRMRDLQGPLGIAYADVLFDCRAERYADVKGLQESLRRYDGFAGVLAEDVVILMTWFADQADDFDWPAGGGGGRGTHHLSCSFRFKYREPRLTL